MIELEDYQKDYEDFWKEIVENEDGTLNKDQVMRELCDYHFMLEQVPIVYDHVSDLSKPNHFASTIINEHDYKWIMKEHACDDVLYILEDIIKEHPEVKNEVLQFFDQPMEINR